MKEGWEYKALGECCDILDAQRKPIKKDKRVRGTIPYYGATGLLDYVKDYIFDETLVLLGEDGAKWGAGEASAYEISGKSWVNNHAHVLRPNKDEIINAWLIYYLNYANLMPYIKGVTVPKLNQQRMSSIRVPIPPLSEQQRIVSYLDSAFAKIDAVAKNAEASLNEAKALFQSALAKMMEPKEGWEEKKLGDITCKITDGSHNPPKGVKHSGFMMLSSKNIRNDRFTFDNPRYLSKTDFEKENLRTDIEKGDVLLTIVGAGLGQCCVYPKEFKVVFQRSAAVIKPRRSEIDNRFLMYSLQNEYENIREKSNGAAQKGIYLSQLAKYVLSLPSLSTQQSIVSTLDSLKSKVDQLQSNLTHTLSECAALKQSILRETFE